MTVHIIQLPYVKPPLTGNGIQRMHRLEKGRVTRKLRAATARLVSEAHVPRYRAIRVDLVWLVNSRHRRDVDNLVPTLKPVADGLVDAGIVPDDTPAFMDKRMPVIGYVSKRDMPDPALYLVIEGTEPEAIEDAIQSIAARLGVTFELPGANR